jgi:hypothetical protein
VIFQHDLSVTPKDWSTWMNHVSLHHASLNPVAPHPQPISRPTSTPYSVIKASIDEILEASHRAQASSDVVPVPVFIGLEQKRSNMYPLEKAVEVDILEIDLDEDGPLRDEYLPKRINRSASLHSAHDKVIALPPPAKWSPAADEPFFPPQRTSAGKYVAVRPPVTSGAAKPLTTSGGSQGWGCRPSEAPTRDCGSSSSWARASHLSAAQHQTHITHARSQSLTHDQGQHIKDRSWATAVASHAFPSMQYKQSQSVLTSGYSWFFQPSNSRNPMAVHSALNHFGPLLRV